MPKVKARPDTTATPSFTWVGKRIPMVDAKEKVEGVKPYITDLKLPGMLHGAILRSPLPHARIVAIDTSKAEQLPGVKAVVTWADTPGVKWGSPLDSLARGDQDILAHDRVRFVGDEIAAVCAEDEATAAAALSLVEVDYAELPPVFDPLEALKPDAPQVHERGNIAAHFSLERGDVERAFAQADLVFEEEYRTEPYHHAYLEPRACVAYWDRNDVLHLHGSNVSPAVSRTVYAHALGLPEERLHMVLDDMGGAFGGKSRQKHHLIAAVLARKAGRPVRLVIGREEDFASGNPRTPMRVWIKIAATREGLLTAKEIRVISDNGAYTLLGPAVTSTAAYRHDLLYRIPNLKAEALTVYTNNPPTTCFRGFGNTEGLFALECSIERIADLLGMDPAELRLRNARQAGDVSQHGWVVGSCALSETINAAATQSGWKKRTLPAGKAGIVRRGIGMASGMHVSSNRTIYPFDGSAAVVRISGDGRVTIFSGEVDVGQGMNTVFAQIAAERLGIAPQQITVATPDSDVTPVGWGTIGSRVTLVGGHAVDRAAADAQRQLLKVASDVLEVPADDLECAEGRIFSRSSPDRGIAFRDLAKKASAANAGQPILGRGSWLADIPLPDPKTKYGNISMAYPFATHVAEVEVDTEDGLVTVLNYVAVHDSGTIINPLTAEGQVEGGVAQGMGQILLEAQVLREGRVLNPNFMDYKLPLALDMPPVHVGFVQPMDPNGPLGAKSIGENAVNPVPAAIANAIYNALGIRVTTMPITPERILELLAEQQSAKAAHCS